ncbi:lipase family protein [Amycolatopsis sp. H20-H5]|uniref:lipase family protein n=1 Tax=Amycolatopsis sp. H20-H5 TaxID=3046309 RepID=UPI002DB55BE7|nr:lipase family protein [Amycolatopsis sp. H20-H5]MEC3978474.1 lipase family protein [Amycolatopsis sp. H20-H5]
MRSRPRRFAAALAVALAAATVSATPATAETPPPPQNDAFYQPPSGYESAPPGTVLRSRPMAIAAFGALPQQVRAWQLLYRTTDTQDRPQATVTTVLLPAGAKPSKSRPLLSYQVAEDSAAPQCAISYQLRTGAGNANIVAQAEILLIDAAVRQGWAVSVPDYEGPKSAYVAGKQAGQAVLDGIRAAETFTPLGLNGTQTDVGLWGYSGGALASGWASELQPGYAPELDLKGVAEGGLPVNPQHVLAGANGGLFAGIAMSGIAGISQAYPELQQFLDTYLTAEGKTALAKARSQCNADNARDFAFKDLYRYFTIADPLSQPVPQAVLAANVLGRHTPAAPLFVYHSVNDELVPHADTDRAVAGYCASGGQVRYQRDILSGHIALVITGAPDALNWLSDRLGGKPAAAGCQTRTVVSSLASPGALTTLGSVLYNDLLALLGAPIR